MRMKSLRESWLRQALLKAVLLPPLRSLSNQLLRKARPRLMKRSVLLIKRRSRRRRPRPLPLVKLRRSRKTKKK